MAPILVPLVSAGIAGAAMYLFDPERGRRRRALVRGKAVRAVTRTREVADAGSRDLARRGQGVVGRLRSVIRRRKVGDRVIAERVRARMGRYVSHPGAVEVKADDGHVTLTGSVLRQEHDALVSAVRGVKGVKAVEDRLVPHASAEGVPELQGGRPRRDEVPELAEDNWSPGTRIVAGAAGATFGLYALRGGVPGAALGLAGLLLLARSATNMPLRQLAGMRGRRGIDIQKILTIDVPVEQAYAHLGDCANYPRFMRNVRRVERRGDGRWHWVVAGPAGAEVQWDAEETKRVPNEVIAWRSVDGSPVAHAGSMRFEGVTGATRIHIRMSYNPPAGALGQAVASLLGADPKAQMDQDLMRLKNALETTRAPHDAGVHQREGGATVPAV